MNRKPADKTYAYLLGCYFGDASVFKRGNTYAYSFECIDKEFIDKVADCLSRFINRDVRVHQRVGTNKYYLQVCSKEFKVLVDDTAGCRYIPDYVYQWSEELKKEFLEGVLDSDGWVSQRSNPNGNTRWMMGYGTTYSWTYDIKRMLQSLGVSCGKTREIQTKNKVQLSFTMNLKSFIESGLKFNIVRKQKRLNNYREKRMKSQRLYDNTD